MTIRTLTCLTTLLLCALLLGCAAGTSKQEEEKRVRIGMHIDALLEFAIEYPLAWQKERRLHRAEERGVVTWTAPVDDGVHLRVVSEPVASAGTAEDRLSRILAELPGFEVTHREEFDLGGHPALQVLGYTSRQNYEFLMVGSERRAFSLQFAAEPEIFGRHAEQRAEILESFVILEPPDVRPHTD